MTIERAHVEIDGYPILILLIDGHSAWVFDPKDSLLEQNIVVLLDDDGWWAKNAVARYIDPDSGESVAVPGGVQDEDLAALTRRYISGEFGIASTSIISS